MPLKSSPMCIILRKVNHHWLLWFLSALVVNGAVAGNPDAKRLYDDLLSNYNKLVRPVVNTSDVLRVCIKLKLSQLIDVVSRTEIVLLSLLSTGFEIGRGKLLRWDFVKAFVLKALTDKSREKLSKETSAISRRKSVALCLFCSLEEPEKRRKKRRQIT